MTDVERSTPPRRRPRERALSSLGERMDVEGRDLTARAWCCPAGRTTSSASSPRPTRAPLWSQRRRPGAAAVGRRSGRVPTTTPSDGVLAYDEGLLIGYRWYDDQGREPLYRFGHGLGYTNWDHQHVGAELDQDGTVTLQVRLKNTGTRPGRDVVQVDASRPDSGVPRPRRWLGFAAAAAAAGEELTVSRRCTPPRPAALGRHHPRLAHRTWHS